MKNHRISILSSCLFGLSALSAPGALLVYEGFQYGNVGDSLMDQPDGSGADVDATGLAGTYSEVRWNDSNRQQLDILSGSLSFGDLATAGNSVGSETTSDENIYVRSITPNLGSGSDLWFSILVQPNESNTASQAGFIISNGSVVSSRAQIPQQNSANGASFDGIGFGSPGNANFRPYVWDGGNITTSTAGLSTSDGSTYMLIGHLSFNTGTAGADEFSLYNYTLNGGSVVGGTLNLIGETLDVDLLEGDLNTFNLTRQRRPTYDEIRIGTTLNDVIPVPEPSVAILGSLGTLLLLRRRRR